MSQEDKYNVNFFKPLTQHARANTKLILTLAIIWAVGVFGFQILLMVFNEPTPEANFAKFEKVWPVVVENDAVAPQIKQDFAKVTLAVLGKNIAVKDEHKAYLKEALSWTVHSMQKDSMKAVFQNEPNEESIQIAAATIGLSSEGFDKLMLDLLPTSLVKVTNTELSIECKSSIPEIMKLYLIHNQSGLTDFNFLGFPFHYWYTAQFLLIMFVLLCLTYAKVIDRMNKKFDFVEET
jgi:putative solute:sodium symporter small subunit